MEADQLLVIGRCYIHNQFMGKNGQDLSPHPTGVETQTHGAEMANMRAQNI